MSEQLILQHTRALGDTVVMTAVVRDLAITYPGRFQIHINSNFRDVWANNPHIAGLNTPAGCRRITLCYKKGITAAGRGEQVHFVSWFHRDFTNKTGIPLIPLLPQPDLHMSQVEIDNPIVEGRYWVVVAGGKTDIRTKHWGFENYQQLIVELGRLGISCVQCGALRKEDIHKPMGSCINLLGRTSVREFFSLIHHADGVICPVTGAMHIAAALNKHCVVIAGGREEPWWEGYTNHGPKFGPIASGELVAPHVFLHTVGTMDCCLRKGCWKRKIGGDKACPYPVATVSGQVIAKCMDRITIDHVVEAVMGHYESGAVPPISEPTGRYRQVSQNNTQRAENAAKQLRDLDLLSKQPPPVPSGAVIAAPKTARKPSGMPANVVRIVRAPAGATGLIAPVRTVQEPPVALSDETPMDADIYDHPVLGGKVTVCVLCYGDYPQLARRCVGSILQTVPPSRLDLRVAGNECSEATVAYLKTVPATKLYLHDQNRYKYPVMRSMLHDPKCPIETNYMVWFDDDTQVINARWMQVLGRTIVDNHNHNVGLYGIHMFTALTATLKKDQRRWFKSAPWFRNRPFQNRSGQSVPNGNCIHFVPGYFWAMPSRLIKEADIPDIRLRHNGGDCTIGCQIYQAGYKIKEFNKGKSHVWCPPKDGGGRRGYSEAFPWF